MPLTDICLVVDIALYTALDCTYRSVIAPNAFGAVSTDTFTIIRCSVYIYGELRALIQCLVWDNPERDVVVE